MLHGHSMRVRQRRLWPLKKNGDQCESCFTFWKRCFGFLEWAEFLKQYTGKPDFHNIVTDALKKFEDKEACAGREQVSSTFSHSVLVERSFTLLTDKDLRRSCGLTRVPKSMMKQTPTLMLPSEGPDKELETNYVFVDPSEPFKKARLRYIASAEQKTIDVKEEEEEVCWPGQTAEFLKMSAKEQAMETGVHDLIQKDMTGHLHLQTVDEFLGKQVECVGDDEEEDEDGTPCMSNSEVVLSGVAALASERTSIFKTPSTKKSKQNPQAGASSGASGSGTLQRQGSQRSLQTSPPSLGDGIADAASGAASTATYEDPGVRWETMAKETQKRKRHS
eukprot:3447646-Amphidinium_carterae.2